MKIDLYAKAIVRDKDLLLNVWFDTELNAEKATSKTPFGSVERSTSKTRVGRRPSSKCQRWGGLILETDAMV